MRPSDELRPDAACDVGGAAMPAASTAVARALGQWHAPWRNIDGSWITPMQAGMLGEDELTRRVSYPLWCARLGLQPQPLRVESSPWWLALPLPPGLFVRISHAVGMVLLFAVRRRDSLSIARQAALRGASADDVRWALQRACLGIPAQASAGPWMQAADSVEAGFVAVRAAVAPRSPALWARLRMHYTHDAACDEPAGALAEPGVWFIEKSWQAAASRLAGGNA